MQWTSVICSYTEVLRAGSCCSGSQGTITVNINGRQQPLSGSFTVSPAQPATTAPELVSTLPSGHRLESSGGSLVKVCPQTLSLPCKPNMIWQWQFAHWACMAGLS